MYEATEQLTIGLVVANAAYAPMGSFVDMDLAEAQRALDLNCRAPLLLAHRYLPAMAKRGRGGLIVMSSLAGQQGSPGLAAYAATKAFGAVLAEGLWSELRGHGVDVLTCVPGAVAETEPSKDQVVRAALRALGRRPRTVPGVLMWLSAAVMSRLLPRRTAITVMGRMS